MSTFILISHILCNNRHVIFRLVTAEYKTCTNVNSEDFFHSSTYKNRSLKNLYDCKTQKREAPLFIYKIRETKFNYTPRNF